MSSLLLTALIVLVLVVINGVFVAAEFALIGVSKASVAALTEEGHAGAKRLKSILDSPRRQDRYIATTQLGVTAASLGLGMYGEHALSQLVMDGLVGLGEWGAEIGGVMATALTWIADHSFVTAHVFASLAAIAFLTFLHVVVGEMVPKSVALARPRATALVTVPITLASRLVLLPFAATLEWLSNRLLLLLGIDRSKGAEGAHHTQEDLAHIVETSRAQGALRSESGRALIEMFSFSQLKAGDVMVPRVAVHAIEVGSTPEAISQVLKDGQHTRYLVYEEDLDQIVGMVHIRDLLQLLRKWEPLRSDLFWPITFVPENMTLDRVLGAMRRDRTHAVVVMDEQGGTAGMVTVKDLFEEVVGTIEEAAVDLEGRQEAFLDEEGRLHVHGTLRVAELAEVLNQELPPTDAETISGLVLLLLGRPAQVGDTVGYGPVRLVVIAVEGRGVKECLVSSA